jgi:murein DD-endopeptidase MepM/ murein hydrolase activator NlpD
MKRRVAAYQTQWLWLFFVMVAATPLLPFSFPFDLAPAAVLLVLAFVRPPRSTRSPVPVTAPLCGTWAVINSPGSKVPSHGMRAYGQEHAIDLLHPRAPGSRRTLGWGLRTRRADEYPAFGAPVHAVAAGTVVAASDRQRDHHGRDTWPTLVFLLLQSMAREIGGTRWILGNHVIIDHHDGTWSVAAHLRHGSVHVRPGDRVRAGQHIGAIGNTGNSSEPHLHFQLMDNPRPTAAAGIAFTWPHAIWTEGELDPTLVTAERHSSARHDMPPNGQIIRFGPNGSGPAAAAPVRTIGMEESSA